MRGFLIGTLATAIAFAVVSYVLPQFDYDGQIGQPRRHLASSSASSTG